MTASNANPLFAGINDARTNIAALRAALLLPALSPDDLIACVPGLSMAAARLSTVEQELRDQPAIPIDVARNLKSLKSELRAAAKLIEHGAEFHRGWARLLGSAAAGYTASGDAVPLAVQGTVALEG
jgi:hypothetical protein